MEPFSHASDHFRGSFRQRIYETFSSDLRLDVIEVPRPGKVGSGRWASGVASGKLQVDRSAEVKVIPSRAWHPPARRNLNAANLRYIKCQRPPPQVSLLLFFFPSSSTSKFNPSDPYLSIKHASSRTNCPLQYF